MRPTATSLAATMVRRLARQEALPLPAALAQSARHVHPHQRWRSPADRPWWMPVFEAKAHTRHGQSTDEQEPPLPPWPVDEIEFNATQPDGGHDKRLAVELQLASGDSSSGGGGQDSGVDEQAVVVAPLTVEQREAVRGVEANTAKGQHALRCGGWVCGKCLAPMPYRSRSVCDVCHTLRHDAEATVRRWRADPGNWTCGRCYEFNFPHDDRCRCCATERAACNEVRVMHHERVADEIKSAAVGSVINVRNRVCRWQCGACEEINSLKCSQCRNCGGERFAMTLSCPTCKSSQTLSNRLMYGNEVQDEKHHTQAFGMHNFFPRLSPTRTCTHCRGPLHGATVTSLARPSWLCACGNVNTGTQVSCMRCRLPRSISSAGVLRRLLSSHGSLSSPGPRSASPPSHRWDFVGCTNWLCESCDDGGVNMASRYVVSLSASEQSARRGGLLLKGLPTSGGRVKVARMVHGDSRCRSCGTPWHHQQLRDDGQCWRCSCHMINQRSSTACVSCGLPAQDGIRVDVLSQWTRGDWLCEACGRHNYRDRVQCGCGKIRPR